MSLFSERQFKCSLLVLPSELFPERLQIGSGQLILLSAEKTLKLP